MLAKIRSEKEIKTMAATEILKWSITFAMANTNNVSESPPINIIRRQIPQ
jgi:hypothetical protein